MMEGEPAKKGPLSLPSDCTYVKRKWLVCRAMDEKLGPAALSCRIPAVRQCVAIGPAQHRGMESTKPRKREGAEGKVKDEVRKSEVK